MRKEDGFITDVEGECNPRHDVDLWLIVLKRFLVELGVWAVYQPRCWIHFVDRQDIGIVDFCSCSVEPGVSVSVTYDRCRAVQGIHVHGEIITNVLWNDGAILQLVEQIAAQVTHFVILSDHKGILEDLLVGIESVNTHTHIEDDIVKGELVHHIARDVNRLVCLDWTGVVPLIICFVEEVFEGRTTRRLVAIRIVP